MMYHMWSAWFLDYAILSAIQYSHLFQTTKGAVYLSELTGQPNPTVIGISFLIKTNHPDHSKPNIM